MSQKDYLRLTPYNRKDGVTTIGVELDEDISHMDIKVGKKLTMTIVGIERKEWEGLVVK